MIHSELVLEDLKRYRGESIVDGIRGRQDVYQSLRDDGMNYPDTLDYLEMLRSVNGELYGDTDEVFSEEKPRLLDLVMAVSSMF